MKQRGMYKIRLEYTNVQARKGHNLITLRTNINNAVLCFEIQSLNINMLIFYKSLGYKGLW